MLDGCQMTVRHDPFVRPTLVVLLRFGCQAVGPTEFFALLRSILLGFVLFFSVDILRLTIQQYFVYDDSTNSINEEKGRYS